MSITIGWVKIVSSLISLIIGVIIGLIVLVDESFFVNIYKRQLAKKGIYKDVEKLKYLPFIAAVILIVKGIIGLM